MELSVSTGSDGLTTVKVKGRITQAKVLAFNEPLAAQLGSGCYAGKVLIDLSGADYIDSSGVSWLIVCHKRFREAGGKMVLYSLSPIIQPVLRLLKMDLVFEIAPDRAAAEALAKGGQA
jgi:anti-anti-sigma factor